MHHLLVVDDEADICDVVKSGFEARGKYRVDCATNKLDAFAALSERPFDLALLDILMRENAGIEIEALAGKMHVPVLRMTGHPEIMQKCLDRGVPVLMKPFRVGELVDTVDRLVEEAVRLQRRLVENMRRAQHLADESRAKIDAAQSAWDDFAEHWHRICRRALDGGVISRPGPDRS